jgi:hypothetical protein
LATRLDPQDAKAVLSVLIRDALDQSGEHLAIGWRRLALSSAGDSFEIPQYLSATNFIHMPTGIERWILQARAQ